MRKSKNFLSYNTKQSKKTEKKEEKNSWYLFVIFISCSKSIKKINVLVFYTLLYNRVYSDLIQRACFFFTVFIFCFVDLNIQHCRVKAYKDGLSLMCVRRTERNENTRGRFISPMKYLCERNIEL